MMIFFILSAHLDSLSLEQAIDIALSQNPAYYESRVSLDKSRLQFYQTLSNYLPSLSASVQYTKYENGDFGTHPYTGRLTLNQPLLDLDVISSIFISNRQLKSTGLQHQAAVAGLVLDIKTAYYNLIYARDLIESSEIAVKRADENLKMIETKYKIGAASKLDKLQAEVFYLSTLQDKASAMTLQTKSQEELKSLLAVDDDLYAVDSLEPPGAVEFPTLDSLIVLLEKANYNIRVARELENVAGLDVASSYLAALPKISLFYGYTYNTDELTFDFQKWQENSSKNYGISISLPIFEIKSLIFDNLNARKELQLQRLAKRQTILESKKSLRTSYFGLQEAYDKLQFAAKSYDAANEAAKIAKEQYALGSISFLELMNAEEDAYKANVSYKSALSDFYIQRANLSYLLGDLALD